MFDSNKLISRFKKQEIKQGFLQLANNPDFTYPYGYEKGATAPVTVDGSDYYIKEVNGDKLSAELLLGQIFNKLGIKSAIYLPVRHDDYSEAISNDVLDDNTIIASVYLSNLKKSVGKYNPFLFTQEKTFLPIDNSIRNTFASKHAIRQNLKMNAVDLALSNWDRGFNNFGVTIQQNKVEDIVLYDHEASGWQIGHEKFHNNFSFLSLPFDEIINYYKTNEEYREYTTPQELAETVGNIEIDKTADDITQHTGHQFREEYLDFLKFRIDKTAETLEQC